MERVLLPKPSFSIYSDKNSSWSSKQSKKEYYDPFGLYSQGSLATLQQQQQQADEDTHSATWQNHLDDDNDDVSTIRSLGHLVDGEIEWPLFDLTSDDDPPAPLGRTIDWTKYEWILHPSENSVTIVRNVYRRIFPLIRSRLPPSGMVAFREWFIQSCEQCSICGNGVERCDSDQMVRMLEQNAGMLYVCEICVVYGALKTEFDLYRREVEEGQGATAWVIQRLFFYAYCLVFFCLHQEEHVHYYLRVLQDTLDATNAMRLCAIGAPPVGILAEADCISNSTKQVLLDLDSAVRGFQIVTGKGLPLYDNIYSTDVNVGEGTEETDSNGYGMVLDQFLTLTNALKTNLEKQEFRIRELELTLPHLLYYIENGDLAALEQAVVSFQHDILNDSMETSEKAAEVWQQLQGLLRDKDVKEPYCPRKRRNIARLLENIAAAMTRS